MAKRIIVLNASRCSAPEGTELNVGNVRAERWIAEGWARAVKSGSAASTEARSDPSTGDSAPDEISAAAKKKAAAEKKAADAKAKVAAAKKTAAAKKKAAAEKKAAAKK